MSAPVWVLDTGALLAYAHGVEPVGRVIADAADTGTTVAVPVTCLLEADHRGVTPGLRPERWGG